MKINIVTYMIVAVLLLFMYKANAGEYRIRYMPNSNHFNDRKHNYNEDQNGVFVEKRIGETWLGFINYENSFDDNSNGYYFGRTLGSWKFIDAGYQMGLVTGYDIDPAPFGLLTFTINFNSHLKYRMALLPIVEANQYFVEF
jgi:hypothetical protein